MNNFHMREGKVEFRWKRWRNKKRQEVSSCLMVLFSGVVLLGAGGVALAGPTGGQITGGSGTITNPNGTTTNINQQSNVLNINWQDFSIGAGETVNFYQPGSTSVAINRVIGGVPSYLAGALNANGRVFILNSAGITFTGTSQVNVGALLATTAMTVNGDPTLAASYSGTGYGAVINQGSISVSNGGFAILAAPYVQNTGFIKADLGTIALAGTNQFTLDLSGTGLINFVVPAGAVEQIVSDGKAVGVDNSGTLQARSGQVVISANVASEVINAVVNLNGIVDADAFAPNGQGGAVLVSAAGDINVGGQVTARGDGAGAGGQIVTKAGGADLIGQMAYVSAAGGATGKGGFIEVSGKTVGLHGTIDPGSGGSLYIDPNNIHVVAANAGQGTLVGSNQTGSTIGSDFIENELAHGANVNLVADHNVFFDALADDHQLVGGNGNLNILAASGNITFAGTNDAIVQGGGFIHMNANGGNIGSSGHAMTLITGVGPTDAGAGVTQAGDIVLTATGDIHVHNVQVKSSGGSVFTAKFSADAGHNFIASGDISVQAVAHGVTAQTASATANIFAHNNIVLHNVTVQALANQVSDTHSSDAHAFANLQLHASENIDVAGGIQENAVASDMGDGGGDAQANALTEVTASGNISVGGDVNVFAIAKQFDSDGSFAQANANLQMHAGSSDTGVVNVQGDIGVHASAQARGDAPGFAEANALADITAGSSIGVGGDVDVTANANQLSSSGEFAEANANLQMHAGSSGTGVVNVQGDIGVHASAQAHGDDGGFAEANALADITAGSSIAVGGNVDVGANANQLSSSGEFAEANANLQMHAGSSGTGVVNVQGDIGVHASAQAHGDDGGFAEANALADITAGSSIAVGGNVDVTANATQLSSSGEFAEANANLQMHAGSSGTGVVNVQGDIGVHASAQANGDDGGFAEANALADITAGSSIAVGGNVDVTANATQLSSSGEFAEANANLQMHAGSSGTGVVNVQGDIGVHASAQANGDDGGFAEANALADITAGSSIGVGGDVDVTANATQLSSSGEFAEANANLQMHAGSSGTGVVNVQGDIGVHASAQANGDDGGFAEANALADITAGSSIAVGGNVDVTANATQLSSSGEFAEANANLQMHAGSSSSGVVNVSGDIGVQANARASGTGFADANALADITAGSSIKIGGNVEGHASANQNGTQGSSAHACANVSLDPSVEVNVNGDVKASANAFSKGSESAVANAVVHILTSGDVKVNGVVTANAHAVADSTNSDTPNNGALALASIDVNGDPVVLGGVDAHATATSHGSVNQANALANVRVHGSSNVSILGDVTVVAKALDDSTASGKGAVANAHLVICAFDGLTSSQNLTLGGDVNMLASANDKALHAGANALASGTIYGRHQVLQSGSTAGITVTAVSHVAGLGSATDALASAKLNVQVPVGNASLGSVTINALADGDGIASTHHVVANAIFSGQAQTIVVNGPASVKAKASGTNDTFVNPMKAQALLTAHAANAARFESGVSASAVASGAGSPSGPGAVTARASVDITAESSIDIDDHLNVGALAVGHNAGLVHATANAILDGIANGPNIFMSGSANVHATASGSHLFAHSSGPVAKALLIANGHQESFDDVTVTALTNASANTMQASANANFEALNGLSIDGVVTVHANAQDSSQSAHNATAHAVLVANAGNALSIDGVDVRASAVSEGTAVSVNATALANLLGTHVTVGNTIVKSVASGHGGVGVSQATLLVTDSSFIHMTGSINVEADLVESSNSPIGADALASLNGHTINVDGPVRVVAMTTGSHAGTGSVFANALLNVHALGNVHFANSIDVEALVNGSDAHTFNAHPVVQVNAGSLVVDGNLKVLANANGASANSVIAAPVLNLTHALVVVTNGIELDALAHGHGVKLIEANATLIDSSHASFTDRGLTKVFAKASGSSASTVQADATLQVNVANASFQGGIDVVASAFGITSASSHGVNAIAANAIANIQANNQLTIGDDLTVTALASGNTANRVTAQALGLLRGNNGVDLTTGNIDVAATANGGSRVSFGTAAAVASLDIFTQNGGVHLGGDVDVTANVSYQPNSSDMSDGVIVGNAFALANGAIVANNGDVTVDGNIDVTATLLDKSGSLGSFFTVPGFGQPGDAFLPQTAAAILNISAHNDVTLHNVTVTANDQLNGTQDFFQFTGSNIFAGAIALTNISASHGDVDVGAIDVEATMNAPNVNSIGFKLGVVGALAVLNVQASSDISADAVTVKALANVGGIEAFNFGSDGGSPDGIGDAVAIANFSAGDSVRIHGNVGVEASYNGVMAQHGIVIAALHVNAIDGSASIDGNVTVDATLQLTGKFGEFGTPEGPFPVPSDEIVLANAVIEAHSGVTVTGDMDVTANVQGNAVKFNAFGAAFGSLNGSHVEVDGNFTVEALVNVTSAESVIADARGRLIGSEGVEVGGSVTVNATALHGNPSGFGGTESGVVISKAVLSASADDGSVNIHHGVTVTANTVELGSEDGLAFAEASANIFGESGVAVGSVVTVRADLLDYADNGGVLTNSDKVGPFGLFSYSGAGGLASAQVKIRDVHSGGVALGGLTVTANATTLNPEFDGNASAFASAEVISSHGPINIAGSVVGLAHANDQGDGGALAVTLIDLEPAASFATTTASLHIGGGVTMNALAELGTMAEGNAMAVAVLNADADSGAVRIDGNVNILANARILSTPSTPDILIFPFGQAAAYANANLEGASGVSVGGGIAVTAKLRSKSNFDQSTIEFALGDNDSFSVEWGHAAAIAQLEASNGGIAVGGVTVASASAVGRGFDDAGTVAATAEVDMEAQGNIRVGGALTRAFASGTDESNASANANTKLNATSGSINAGPGGLTATAIALASNATHANAQANVAADASNNIFIRGNVISLAVAVSGGSGNTAHAKTHLAAGGATSSFDGPPSQFGNITVIGNIGAFAFADATNDEATASVEIFAHNNLLIVGADPIASARVGPSGGTTFAFRQAHFTTNDGTNFGPGGGALADIDIRAGGFVAVFPTSSLSAVEKLYSLPTDYPTLNSSLGLTIIPLSVDGEDCGVLGIAGKDQAAINKALGCHHKPINVSDLTDTGP